MPGMSGADLLHALRTAGITAPVILISATRSSGRRDSSGSSRSRSIFEDSPRSSRRRSTKEESNAPEDRRLFSSQLASQNIMSDGRSPTTRFEGGCASCRCWRATALTAQDRERRAHGGSRRCVLAIFVSASESRAAGRHWGLSPIHARRPTAARLRKRCQMRCVQRPFNGWAVEARQDGSRRHRARAAAACARTAMPCASASVSGSAGLP
jgi:CheY-like chemotaxis protein